MLEAYVAAGLDPARFWDITPRLYAIEMKGALTKLKRERGLAWEMAALMRMQKMPTHEDFVGTAPKPPRPESELALWLRASNRGLKVITLDEWKRGKR